MVTKEQYECAMNLIRNYRNNPDFKSCGTEYMDDAERNSYELACDIVYQYGQQIAAYRRQQKLSKVK
jgi:hypothetical protein